VVSGARKPAQGWHFKLGGKKLPQNPLKRRNSGAGKKKKKEENGEPRDISF